MSDVKPADPWLLGQGDKIQFYALDRDQFGMPPGLLLIRTNMDSQQWYGTVTWKEVGPYDVGVREDLLIRDRGLGPSKLLESLCQELLRAGYGRDAAIGAKSELAATKAHLEDMRRLVFAKPTEPPVKRTWAADAEG